ncbi:MAG: phospholipase A [bacterium]|nr:phospholipase A [Betaproteobacteria bacterium]
MGCLLLLLLLAAGPGRVDAAALMGGAGAVLPSAGAASASAIRSGLPSGTLSVESVDDAMHRSVQLVWTLLNEGGAGQAVEVPATIEVAVESAGRTYRLQARMPVEAGAPVVGVVTVAPGQFRRVRYRLELPPAVAGATVFRTSAGGRALVAFADRPAGPGDAADVATAAATAQSPAAAALEAARPGDSPAGARVSQTDRLGSAISAHEPVYIAFGDRERRNARFQISFKYRLFNEGGDLARDLAPLRHVYFGYTQTALWDLESDSAPFRDSSYRPSLFYRNDALWTSAARGMRLGLAAGVEHESNGRDGPSSRSINTAFVRPMARLGDPAGWQLTLGPRLHGYLDRDGNADIARYRGHADLFASIGHPDRWQFSSTLRRGTGKHFGSTLVEASYPLRTVSLGNLDGYIYFQYFNGYGESILDYDRRFPAQLRIGFAITRWP